MKKSSIFISEINFKIKESNQLKSTMKHTLRTYSRFNVDETNTKNNIYSLDKEFQEYTKTTQKEKITQENIAEYIMKYVEEMKKQYEIKTNTTQEIFKSNDNIRDLKKTSKRRLENKNMNMTLEELEKQLSTEEIETEEHLLNKITEYVNSKWDNTKYKSESQSTRLKNNVINSVFKYQTNKKNYVKTTKKESLNINNTYVQELVFKPLTKGSFQMSNEELLSLRTKIMLQEKEKGNIVLASRIHNDESLSPHIHFFIFSKDFNLGQNQVNFINKKYNKSFNSVLTQDEKTEYGQLKQKHYYETVNSVLTDNKRFVLKHLVNETINSNEEIEQLTEEEQLILNNRNDERKRENRRIKIRTGKTSISKRKYNRKTLMLENQEEEHKKLHQLQEDKLKNDKEQHLLLQQQIKERGQYLKEQQKKIEELKQREITIQKRKQREKYMEEQKKEYESIETMKNIRQQEVIELEEQKENENQKLREIKKEYESMETTKTEILNIKEKVVNFLNDFDKFFHYGNFSVRQMFSYVKYSKILNKTIVNGKEEWKEDSEMSTKVNSEIKNLLSEFEKGIETSRINVNTLIKDMNVSEQLDTALELKTVSTEPNYK